MRNRITGRRQLRGKDVWPYLFVLPFFAIYLAFNLYPLIYSFVISLTNWNGFTDWDFVGFKNYIKIFTNDAYFLLSIRNTIIFMLWNIPIVIIGGVVLAAALNSSLLKRSGGFRMAFFLPYLTIPVAIGVLFSLLFDWNSGVINRVLESMGLIDERINFLGTPALARGVVVLMVCWKYLGYHMIFFNAGILGIPAELYEAAEVDGASGWKKFTKITVPMLKPIIEFLFIMNIIWGFQFFDEPKVLFSPWLSVSGGSSAVGGPGRVALTAIWNLYDTTFGTQMKYGKGAAIAYGIFLFILLFSMMGFLVLRSRKLRGGEEA